MNLISFAILVGLVALWVKFVLTLMEKWGIREWLQIHTSGFFHKLFICDFCCSFHIGMASCILLAILAKEPLFLAIPIFSCNLR